MASIHIFKQQGNSVYSCSVKRSNPIQSLKGEPLHFCSILSCFTQDAFKEDTKGDHK